MTLIKLGEIVDQLRLRQRRQEPGVMLAGVSSE